MFANARMYSIAPPVAEAWRTLFAWVGERAGIDWEILDYPPPQRLDALWSRPDMGCAFMCGYPWSHAAPQPVILAAPVPRAAAYSGKPVYWSDIVVRADAPYRQLADVFGKRFAYTAETSQSGYQAARALFAPLAHGSPIFAKTVGPMITPRSVIHSVLADDADAAPLDSYVHDLLRAHEPALAARLRTIASTPPTAIPPLVAAAGMDPDIVTRLRNALLSTADASEMAGVLATLCLAGFAVVPPTSYDVLRERAGAADAAGYPRLA